MTKPQNWYTLPVDIRYPAIVARCVELMGQEEFDKFETDYAFNRLQDTLLLSMENWLLHNDLQAKKLGAV